MDTESVFHKMKEVFDKLPSAEEIAVNNAYSEVYPIMDKRISEHDPDLTVKSSSKEFLNRDYDFRRCNQHRFEWLFVFKGKERICSILIDWGWTKPWESDLREPFFTELASDRFLNPITVNDVTNSFQK